jgi:hypothetical protein
LVFPRETKKFVERNMSLSLLYPLVSLSTSFGGGYSGNNERLVVPAFLTFYALLATVIEQRICYVSPEQPGGIRGRHVRIDTR